MVRPPIHPGEILAEELCERRVDPAQLARELDMPDACVREILAGERAMTADAAWRLGRWFGTGPEVWMNLQESYDVRQAKR